MEISLPELIKYPLPSLPSFYVWEIMHATIKKMNKHVAKLQKEVEDAKDRLEAAQRKVHKLGLQKDICDPLWLWLCRLTG